MGQDFIQVLHARRNGRCGDACMMAYIDGIDAMIRSVYNHRFKGAWRPEKRGDPASKARAKATVGRHGFGGDRLQVDPETFSNRCWEQLENQNLLEIACDRNFDDDAELRRFVYVSFHNILQEMVAELTPGLSTRMRQMQTALRRFCRKVKISRRAFWILNDMDDTETNPASLDTLMAVMDPVLIPQPRYPAGQVSGRGPSVSLEAMSVFLEDLVRSAGGAAYHSDLIELIKTIFGLAPMRHADQIPGRNEGDQDQGSEERAFTLDRVRQAFGMAQEHVLMALELFSRMDNRMKSVYYHRRILHRKITDVAEHLSCSTGTVSGVEKAVDRLIFDYFYSESAEGGSLRADPGASSPEEIEDVKKYLAQLIIREKEEQ